LTILLNLTLRARNQDKWHHNHKSLVNLQQAQILMLLHFSYVKHSAAFFSHLLTHLA
jgi:hypothetical protein